jgi:hypothetical protein
MSHPDTWQVTKWRGLRWRGRLIVAFMRDGRPGLWWKPEPAPVYTAVIERPVIGRPEELVRVNPGVIHNWKSRD